jgi:integrase
VPAGPRRCSLTRAQVDRAGTAAGPHGLIVMVLAYTGLRWGELAALRVKRWIWTGGGC